MDDLKRQGICAPSGFYANGIHCGLRRNKSRKDLALVYSDTLCVAASCYTQNKIKGAPLLVTKEHLYDHRAQAIIVNSGNANTCNLNGEKVARQMCELLSLELGIKKEDVIVSSTGVIGQELNIQPIEENMACLVEGLSELNSQAASEAIMTTDTTSKQFDVSFEIDGFICHLGAIAKGSGMIHPNMATMLAFMTSDIQIEAEILQDLLQEVCDDTFNMVSVDGDTSTNDMLTMICNGKANNPMISSKDENYQIVKKHLFELCTDVARAIAKDGEGATKLLTCKVYNGEDLSSTKAIAKSVIASSLVKSAMFGCDANWGRVLCAIGYSDAHYDPETIDVSFCSSKGEMFVCQNSKGIDFDEEAMLKILKEDEIEIIIDLKQGHYNATSWGCDLTYEYVKINGEYRT